MPAVANDHDEVDKALLQALDLVRSQFLEMPGLRLTAPQAARLFALDAEVCVMMLERLIENRFLVRTHESFFARAAEIDASA